MSNQPKHIAVMRLSAMGDVAMTVPVLRALVNQNPEIKITVVSRKFYKPLFNNIPNLTFFEFDAENRHQGFFGIIRLFQDIKNLNINAFADLHNVLRSKIVRSLFAICGKKTAKVNKRRADQKALTRPENKIYKQLPTVFERHCQVFRELGYEIDLLNPQFPEKEVLDLEIQNLIKNKNQKLIGIAPFAQYDSKVYPIDLLQQVIDELAANPENKILLFGGGRLEIETFNLLASSKENIINCAGKMSFENEIKLISNLDVMLTMDSGNSHIAAMLGIKVVTLWGATHPFAGFAPFNQPLENCLIADRNRYPKLPTSIYGNKIVAGYQTAMRTIIVKDIVVKIQSQLIS